MANDPAINLEDRVAVLERQNRRLKRVGLVALVVAGAALLMGAGEASKTLEAEKFLLKDASGKVAAELKIAEHGPTLAFLDAAGKSRLEIGLSENGPGLVYTDPDGKIRAALLLTEKGPSLGFRDTNGQFGMILAHSKFFLGDAKGRNVNLTADEKQAGMMLTDAAGKPRASLSLTDGGPTLALQDATGRVRADMAVDDTGGHIFFMDENGNLLFKQP